MFFQSPYCGQSNQRRYGTYDFCNSWGYGRGNQYGSNSTFILIVVLFILLVIVGKSFI